MPFSIRLGNPNPDEKRASCRVGGGFVKPEGDGRDILGESRGSTHPTRVGEACVRLCGLHAAELTRLDSWNDCPKSLVTTAATFFRFLDRTCDAVCVFSIANQEIWTQAQSYKKVATVARCLPLDSLVKLQSRADFPALKPSSSLSTSALRGRARRISSSDGVDRSVTRALARVTLANARAGQGWSVDRHRTLR